MTGPRVYVYCAALYCEPCGDAIKADLAKPAGYEADNESSYDSDDYPKGPYPEGGGEADTPNHCDACGLFLQNPLTPEGRRYVSAAIREADQAGRVSIAGLTWRPFYGFTVSGDEPSTELEVAR